MALRRPTHLVQRQIRGRAFSEEIFLVREVGHRNSFGEHVSETTRTHTLCATAPATKDDARVRELLEGAVALNDTRLFWTVETLDPVVPGGGSGDIIEWQGDRFRAHSSSRWGGFSETIAVREDVQ